MLLKDHYNLEYYNSINPCPICNTKDNIDMESCKVDYNTKEVRLRCTTETSCYKWVLDDSIEKCIEKWNVYTDRYTNKQRDKSVLLKERVEKAWYEKVEPCPYCLTKDNIEVEFINPSETACNVILNCKTGNCRFGNDIYGSAVDHAISNWNDEIKELRGSKYHVSKCIKQLENCLSVIDDRSSLNILDRYYTNADIPFSVKAFLYERHYFTQEEPCNICRREGKTYKTLLTVDSDGDLILECANHRDTINAVGQSIHELLHNWNTLVGESKVITSFNDIVTDDAWRTPSDEILENFEHFAPNLFQNVIEVHQQDRYIKIPIYTEDGVTPHHAKVGIVFLDKYTVTLLVCRTDKVSGSLQRVSSIATHLFTHQNLNTILWYIAHHTFNGLVNIRSSISQQKHIDQLKNCTD